MPLLFFTLTLLSSYALIAVSLLHMLTFTIIIKCMTSILFLVTAWISYKRNPHSPKFFKLMFAGLFFSFLGDAFLAFDTTGEGLAFIFGVASFALGHIMYILGYTNQCKFRLQDLIIFLGYLCPTLFIIFFINFDFKDMQLLVIIYAFIISFMVGKSFGMRSYYAQNPFSVTCLITGSLLFFVSDCLLLFLFFYPGAPSFLQQCNWFLYYLGQALLAISFFKGTPNN